MTTITIPVSGMHCGACQQRVQTALAKTEGVTDATVDLAKKHATITYDAGAVVPEKLVQVINATGYQAELPDGGRDSGHDGGQSDGHSAFREED